MTSEHGPVYQADENFEVLDRLALHAYVWEGGFRWVGNWQDEFWSASAKRVGLCSHGDADTQWGGSDVFFGACVATEVGRVPGVHVGQVW